MPSLQTLIPAAAIAWLASTASAAYTIQDVYDSSNFFDGFNFYDGPDPTNGFVDYVNADTANSAGLAGLSADGVYMGVDHTTMSPPNGRASVRLESKKQYTLGLFIADIKHMPGAECGSWPAFWTYGPDWPNAGEIDIMEGVNTQLTNDVTLHTSGGCSMNNPNSQPGSVLSNADCSGTGGCGQTTTDPSNYGTGFNDIGGGVYAMEWTNEAIAVYFFPRYAIPDDISSGNPDPSTWGTPLTNFVGDTCDIGSHFKDHYIVFDTTFCGDWAGGVWGDQCGARAATCEDFVSQNPAAFEEGYWLVNSVKVYTDSGSSKREVVPRSFMA